MDIRKIILAVCLLVSVSVHAVTTPVITAATTLYTEDKTAITVTSMTPSFVIQLKSNPTTGYHWFLRAYNGNLMTAVGHSYHASVDKKLIGAPGYEIWTFKAKPAAFVVPQQTTIRFAYARPWQIEETGTQKVFRVSCLQGK